MTFKDSLFFLGTIFQPHLKLMTAVLQKLLQTSKHTNTSPPRRIKRADDSAVERRSVGPAQRSSCCVHTYTAARLHAERRPPSKALANYYYHRHSEGLPTAWLWHTPYTHSTHKSPIYSRRRFAALCLRLLQHPVRFVLSDCATTFGCFLRRWMCTIGSGGRIFSRAHIICLIWTWDNTTTQQPLL